MFSFVYLTSLQMVFILAHALAVKTLDTRQDSAVKSSCTPLVAWSTLQTSHPCVLCQNLPWPLSHPSQEQLLASWERASVAHS